MALCTWRSLLCSSLILLALVLGGCPPSVGLPGATSVSTERMGGGARIISFSESTPYAAVATFAGSQYAGTARGLLQFDPRKEGAEVVKALEGKGVVGISAESTTGLWVATSEGLHRLNKEEWTNIKLPTSLGGASPAMLATRDGLWVGGTRGLGLLDKKGGWKTYLPGARITYLLEDIQSGGVWVATDGEGIYHYEMGQFVPHALANGQLLQRVRSLTYTPDGGVLAVGQSSQGERLTFFDGRFWTTYRVLPEGVLHWVQMVGQDLYLGHGHGVFNLHRMMIKTARPGESRQDMPRGPVDIQAQPSKLVPYGYPVPAFYTSTMEVWLPPKVAVVAGYARHILLGTDNLGMALFDGKKVTWYRGGSLLGDNGRLRMGCSGAACYVPGADGKAYRFVARRYEEVEVTSEPGARVQGFLNLRDGTLASVHIPAGRQSLVVSTLRGERFTPLYESTFNYPSGSLEVRFLRQGPKGHIWAGLWYTDKVADRQSWGVVVLQKPVRAVKVAEKGPAPREQKSFPSAPVADKAAKEPPEDADEGPETDPPADEEKDPLAGAPAEGDKKPEDAPPADDDGDGDADKKPETAGEADAAAKKKPEGNTPEGTELKPLPTTLAQEKAAPATPEVIPVPKISAVTFHRSTLLPDEERPEGSLALPDDVRDVWFEETYTWLATGQGVCRVKGQVVDLFSENEGLYSELTYAVVRSFSGELLVATYSGVGRMMGKKWYFDFEGALAKATRMLLPVEGGLWLGTTRGVVRMGGGKELRFDSSMGLAANDVTDLYLQQTPGQPDKLWVLTPLGLSIVRIR